MALPAAPTTGPALDRLGVVLIAARVGRRLVDVAFEQTRD